MIPKLTPETLLHPGARPAARRGVADAAVPPLAQSPRDRDAGDGGEARLRRLEPAAACAGGRAAGTDALRVVPGLELAFKVEPLGMLFALVAGSLWIVNSIYSIGYMRGNDEPRQTTFYVCFAVAIACDDGHRLRQEPVHAVRVLRGADALDLSARHPQGDAGGDARGPRLSAAAARHLDGAAAAGDHRDRRAGGHARLHARRHPGGQGRRRRHGPAAGALRIRHRQGSA